jgi:tRNA(adenine34) deaminase
MDFDSVMSKNAAKNHVYFMEMALREAELAEAADEVPIGAVLVGPGGAVLASAGNGVISRSDPTAHAEILALRHAAGAIGNYRLPGTTLYVTVEPCPMCMGAVIHARISTLVYGTEDPKWGAAGSLYDFSEDLRLNHRPEIVPGVCRDRCRHLMQRFFQRKRGKTGPAP